MAFSCNHLFYQPRSGMVMGRCRTFLLLLFLLLRRLSIGHLITTLPCLIVTARCLLGRVFLLPTCVKSDDSISFFQQRLQRSNGLNICDIVTCNYNPQYWNKEALKKPVLINNARLQLSSVEYLLT